MPKKKKQGQDEEIIRAEVIQQMPVEEVMHTSMIPYAEYVVMERALPRVEDGLKPVQRRILYTMMELGNTPDKPYKKSARVAGDTMGKYHPHGDSSIYDAMVRLAQDFVMRAPLVDGHGNFGSIDGDSAAAMRYTEVRMAPLALELLRDIDKETVGFHLNFDDSLKEPDVLPGRFPNLLVNGAMGIAVGLATNIPTHNLGEVVRAVAAQIDNPKITCEELMQYIPGPDFPTGGIIIGKEGIEQAYKTGKGKIRIRSRCTIEDGPSGKHNIVIHEVPYQVNKAAMLEKILKLSEEKKDVLSGISDIRDESDRTGLRAVIEIKKGFDAEKILQYLYRYSDLEVSFGINMVAIADGKPKQLSLREINTAYIDHQVNVVTRRTRYEKEQAEAREHILEGLVIALNNIDEVIRIIRGSRTVSDAKKNLMKTFDLTGVQAQAILDMRLQRLTSLEVETLQKELEEVRKLIARLSEILRSRSKLMNLIKTELLKIAKMYEDPRRTLIVDDEEKAFNPDDYKVVEPVTVTVTRSGYVKRMADKTYQRSNREAVFDELEPDDSVLAVMPADTASRLMVFTETGYLVTVPVADLPDARWKDRGAALTAVTQAAADEKICAAFVLGEENPKEDLVFVTESGMAKIVPWDELITRNRRCIVYPIKEGDRLLSVSKVEKGSKLLMISETGMALMTDPDQISHMGRTAKGVRGMELGPDDRLLLAGMFSREDQAVLFSDKGYAKRIHGIDFAPQNRAGKGTRAFAFYKNGSNGTKLSAALKIRERAVLHTVLSDGESQDIDTDTLPLERMDGRGKPVLLVVLDIGIRNIWLHRT